MQYDIRVFDDPDLPSLARIYKASIRYVGNEYYSDDQIAAWSSFPDDIEAFQKWITVAMTFVAIDNQQSFLGFGGLEDHGRISSLYVSPNVMRKGIGAALLKQLTSEVKIRGIATVTTEASEFSKSLFEKFGFTVKNIEHTEFNGIKFTRYAMRLRI